MPAAPAAFFGGANGKWASVSTQPSGFRQFGLPVTIDVHMWQQTDRGADDSWIDDVVECAVADSSHEWMVHRGERMRNGVASLLALTLLSGQSCVPNDGVRVAYNVTTTSAGSFAVYGDGNPPPALADDMLFGPGVGYPEPLGIVSSDLGLLTRPVCIIFETESGDLRELLPVILDAGGQVAAEPVLDPASTATRIGVDVPAELAEGRYTMELRTPNGCTIARVTFTLEDLIF